MKNSISKKHKHLTSTDRAEIQDGLYRLKSFKKIAKSIDKDPSTVSKEIRLLFEVNT